MTAVGDHAQQWLCGSSWPAGKFRKAPGNAEFYTDGTSVNTRQGWREMRLSVWAKRSAGEPAEPSEWDSRSLPKPTARWICAGIADTVFSGVVGAYQVISRASQTRETESEEEEERKPPHTPKLFPR